MRLLALPRLRRLLHRARSTDGRHQPFDEVVTGYPGPKRYLVLACSCGKVFYDDLPAELTNAIADSRKEVAS